MMLFSLGINQAVTFNLGRRTFNVSEMATAATVLGLIQSILTIAVGLLVIPHALAKYSPGVQQLGIVFLLLMPAFILGAYASNMFQGRQDLLRFNVIRVLPQVVYLFGLFAIAFTRHPSLRRVIFAQAAGYLVCLLVGAVMVWKTFRPGWSWNRAAIPSLVKFGYKTQATNLANYFNQRIDQVLLSLFVPPAQLGLYAVAVTLSTAMTVFSVAAGIVTFSRGASQHSDDARVTIGESFRASFVWLLASCSLLFVVAPLLIRIVFGTEFDGSASACRILLPGTFMIGMNQVLYNGSSALGRPELPSYAEGVSVAITAVGLLLLVPRYGYIGAAIVSSVAYTVSFIVMLGLSHKLLGLTLRVLLVMPRRQLGAES
jgi:O-antigen/teichoic acid export membrane protein